MNKFLKSDFRLTEPVGNLVALPVNPHHVPLRLNYL